MKYCEVAITYPGSQGKWQDFDYIDYLQWCPTNIERRIIQYDAGKNTFCKSWVPSTGGGNLLFVCGLKSGPDFYAGSVIVKMMAKMENLLTKEMSIPAVEVRNKVRRRNLFTMKKATNPVETKDQIASTALIRV